MQQRNGLLVVVSISILLAAGCQTPVERMNAPPQGESETKNPLAESFAYHEDQGMLADLSLADLHFVPHSADLSGVGVARLERYAELLASSGGTLNFTTSSRDPELAAERLETANDFLRRAVPGSKPVQVVLGLPRGRGMAGKESVAGKGIAKQPETRLRAYRLTNTMQSGASGK